MEVNTYILWTEVYNSWISAHTIGAMRFSPWLPTIWRIIPGLVGGSWPALNLYATNGHLEREQPYLGDLLIMVINHLLTGMILQVPPLCTETTVSHFGIPYKFTGITALSSYLSRFVWFVCLNKEDFGNLTDAGDLRRSVADRASSYSRAVDEGKVILSGAVSLGFFEACHGCSTVQLNAFCYDGGASYHMDIITIVVGHRFVCFELILGFVYVMWSLTFYHGKSSPKDRTISGNMFIV